MSTPIAAARRPLISSSTASALKPGKWKTPAESLPVNAGVPSLLAQPAAGGAFARPLLPGFWGTVGGLLPPGAGVDLVRSVLFFDGARVLGPIAVLLGWALLGVAFALWRGGHPIARAEAEIEAAAAVAAA